MNCSHKHRLFVSLVSMIFSVGMAAEDMAGRATTAKVVTALRSAKATSAARQSTDAARN